MRVYKQAIYTYIVLLVTLILLYDINNMTDTTAISPNPSQTQM